jgi:ribosomal protein S18 acetylase RimI-like enzyme
MTRRTTSVEPHPELPAGFTARAGAMDDVPAAIEICELNERRILGETTGIARIYPVVWSAPGTEIDRDLRVIESREGVVVGFAHVKVENPCVQARAERFVHPDHEGRGLGAFLLHWAERHARELTAEAPAGARTSLHEYVLSGDEPGGRLLREHGFAVVRHVVHMRISFERPPESPIWPEGIALHPLDWNEHGRAVSSAYNEVFKDHWGFAPTSDDDVYEQIGHWLGNDPDVDPELWFIAWDGDEIAGINLCLAKDGDDRNRGHIGSLGVRRPWRGKGLGLALLRHSFSAFHQRGQRQASLEADAENITGALRLYTKAGMHIHRRSDIFEKELRAGEELRVREEPR